MYALLVCGGTHNGTVPYNTAFQGRVRKPCVQAPACTKAMRHPYPPHPTQPPGIPGFSPQASSELELRRAAWRAAHVVQADARSLAAQLAVEMQKQTQAFAKELRRSPRARPLMSATHPDQQLVRELRRQRRSRPLE